MAIISNFTIPFDDTCVQDIHERLIRCRFPEFPPYSDWAQGTTISFLKEIIPYWIQEYDWSKTVERLNKYPQYIWEADGMKIHLFHIQSERDNAPTVLMAHGWPDSFLRYAKTFELLKDYNLVVPTMPGFGFSTLPMKGYINNSDVADLWHRLMNELGYKSYFATGGDMGRGVVSYLASRYSNEIRGLLLTDVGFAKEIVSTADEKLTEDELDYKQRALKWLNEDGAYINIQSTKPHSLAIALTDSPAGMASWLAEKFHDWSDWERLSKDDLLDNLTLYLLTGCTGTSIMAYYGNSNTLPPLGKVTCPIAFAAFPHDILPVPEKWIRRNYNIIQFTRMSYGGHFTAMENPEEFSQCLRLFIQKIAIGL